MKDVHIRMQGNEIVERPKNLKVGQRYAGHVKFWNAAMRYGYIAVDGRDPHDGVRVHYKDLQKPFEGNAKVGDKVEFDLAENGFEATNVTVIVSSNTPTLHHSNSADHA